MTATRFLFGLRRRQAAAEGRSDQCVAVDAKELDMAQQSLNRTAVFDRAGMSASLACAVHCALLPVALAALPALGLAWLDSPWVDWSMVILALGIALRAHRGGYRLHHRCPSLWCGAWGRRDHRGGYVPADRLSEPPLRPGVWRGHDRRVALAESPVLQDLCDVPHRIRM